MKKIYLAIALATASVAMAQTGSVGINTDAPKATLEIVKSTTAAATDAQGVIIPKATVSELDGMTNVATSTLIFVEDTTFPQSATTTKKVDANGFYYFNGTEWVKVGGAGGDTAGPVVKNFRTLNLPVTAANWQADDYTIAVQGAGGLELPSPVNNKGRVISVRNLNSTTVTYDAANAPRQNNSIRGNRGQLIHSDGVNWHVIGGF